MLLFGFLILSVISVTQESLININDSMYHVMMILLRARSGKKEVPVCLPMACALARSYTGGVGA